MSGCPCLYTTPCQDMCTCAGPLYSAGCRRCATYGSLEQRTGMAVRLARIIDERNAAEDAVRPCQNCGEPDPDCDHWDDLDGPNRAGWTCTRS